MDNFDPKSSCIQLANAADVSRKRKAWPSSWTFPVPLLVWAGLQRLAAQLMTAAQLRHQGKDLNAFGFDNRNEKEIKSLK